MISSQKVTFSFVTSLFTTLLALAAGFSLAMSTVACSDDPSGGDGDGDDDTLLFCKPAETCPPSVDGVDLTTPVSFRTDVYAGYFRDSCGGGSGCHGLSSNAAAGLHLGRAETPLDDAAISALINQLKNAPSELAPGERNVVAGDWQSSWLMAKLDGCQADYGITCNADSQHLVLSVCGTACGDGMPQSDGTTVNNPTPFPTTAAEREKVHKVRAWIAQGAENN